MLNEIKYIKLTSEYNKKSCLDQRQGIIKEIQEYVTNKVNIDFSDMLNKIENFGFDVKAAKIENGKYHLEAMKEVKSLKLEIENYNKIKEDLLNDLKAEKSEYQESKEDYIKMKLDFIATEKTHSEINDTLKVNLIILLINFN